MKEPMHAAFRVLLSEEEREALHFLSSQRRLTLIDQRLYSNHRLLILV